MSDARKDAPRPAADRDAELRRLRAENRQLKNDVQQLQAEVDKLQSENKELRGALKASERSAKRQAAPFSRNKPKENRKKPGRKAGAKHGKHGHRPLPDPETADEKFTVPMPCQCPDCGGKDFIDLGSFEQWQDEVRREVLRRLFTIFFGTCKNCGQRVQSRHPLQTSDAAGACASQLGPVAQAAIVYYNKHAGMSYGKISDTMDKLHGIKISRGGCAQIVMRAAEKLEPALIEIQEKIKGSEHITPDETGWRVGGQPVWLHCWVGDDGATCYTIDPKRGADALIRLIGIHWSGKMTHDGFSSYDRFEEACHQQCVDHALRRARGLVEKYPENAAFPLRVISILTATLKVRDRHRAGEIDDAELAHWHKYYLGQLDALTAKPQDNEDYRTFANHLYCHSEHWFMFLLNTEIPATNHKAERGLRTPIVNRKVFGGNQEPTGARAQGTTSSVLQTCKNRAVDFIGFVSDAICGCVASLFV